MIVSAIRPEHLGQAWRDVGPILARAVRYTPDKPDVLHRLLDGTAQLWAVIAHGRPIAAAVTELTTRPDRWCRLWLVAGEGVASWAAPLLACVEAWARRVGCIGLWGSGREGWARLARRHGWRRAGSDAGFPRWTWRF